MSTKEIKTLVKELFAQTKTREEVANWASELIKKEDDGTLAYEPALDEDKIWNALLFLSGIDLKDTPHTYLHSLEDITSYLDKNWA